MSFEHDITEDLPFLEDVLKTEAHLERFFYDFYQERGQIPTEHKKSDMLEIFKKNLTINMKRFLHEYEMSYLEYFGKGEYRFHIKGELSTEFQQYIIAVAKFLHNRSPSLKPAYTIQGKNAEGIFMLAVNSMLHYFRFRNKLKFNKKSFRYGGDGGYDFAIGKYKFDVKHRDDGPNSGLILRESFLERAEDDVVLVFVTNATNIKLGDGFNKRTLDLGITEVERHLADQVFPLAITGWISIKEFKEKMTQRSGRDRAFVVDQLNPIVDLFMDIVEDQIESEALFV